jgi:hypothetical protein
MSLWRVAAFLIELPPSGHSTSFFLMPDRRYTDEEVAAIFTLASEEEQASTRQLSSAGEGLTLAELQEIGREAGIAPERVAKAVQSLDDVRQPAPPKFLGLPLGVSRTVKLDHRMTDEEWERLVVDLRDTFDARGSVRTDGSFRQWANGNLQVLVEPDGDGQRIRFRTVKGNSRALMMGGLGMLGVAAATTLAAMLFPTTGASQALANVGTIALMGAGVFTIGALRLPSWAKLRRQQMEEVARRLTSPR